MRHMAPDHTGTCHGRSGMNEVKGGTQFTVLTWAAGVRCGSGTCAPHKGFRGRYAKSVLSQMSNWFDEGSGRRERRTERIE